VEVYQIVTRDTVDETILRISETKGALMEMFADVVVDEPSPMPALPKLDPRCIPPSPEKGQSKKQHPATSSSDVDFERQRIELVKLVEEFSKQHGKDSSPIKVPETVISDVDSSILEAPAPPESDRPFSIDTTTTTAQEVEDTETSKPYLDSPSPQFSNHGRSSEDVTLMSMDLDQEHNQVITDVEPPVKPAMETNLDTGNEALIDQHIVGADAMILSPTVTSDIAVPESNDQIDSLPIQDNLPSSIMEEVAQSHQEQVNTPLLH
jgi:hypothetical protein